MTQKELSGKISTTYASVSRWELGQTQPTFEQCETIAAFFHVTPQYLVGWTNEPN